MHSSATRWVGWLVALALVGIATTGADVQPARRIPAFPGAEGFGAFTQGGRGGAVLFVTSLDDYDAHESPLPGTLRAAVDREGPRTIVFRVSGHIELKRPLEIWHPYLTIAGQTAPGDGVSIRNFGVVVAAPNVVLRYLRIRPGDVSGEALDALNIMASDVIVDHCSASWATDETVSVIDRATNVTIQWSFITESLNASVHAKGEHGYGSLISTPGSVSVHHSVYAFHKSRNPRPRDVLLDFRHNLIYGWGDRAGYNGDDSARINYVGNLLRPLPYSHNARHAFIVGGEDTRLYLEDNVLRHPDGSERTGWRLVQPPPALRDGAERALGVDAPFSAPPVTAHKPKELMDLLLDDAGATRPRRDSVDRRVVDLMRRDAGAIIDSQNDVGGWPTLSGGPIPADRDRDGMPDRWESRFGLDPEDSSDHSGDLDGDGYTNLEEYLNGTDPGAAVGVRVRPEERSARESRAASRGVVASMTTGEASAQSAREDAWSVRMAETVMERSPTLMDRWHYELGLMLKAFERLYDRTDDERYYEYIRRNLDQFIQDDGSIRTYDLSDYNLDQIASGKLLFELYERTGEVRYRRAADTLRKQLEQHPRTSEGGFWHKKVYPWQIWLDGVYMAGPFLARYGIEYDDPSAVEDVTREILLVARYLRDPATGLYYHGWDESREQAWADSVTGLSRSFWGRGMGWYGMALVDVLDYLPEDHPDREAIIRVLRDFAEAVTKVQDPVTGLWYQVLDQPQRKENYLEASASNMFTYALAKGVRRGFLRTEFLDVARRAHAGVIRHFIREDDSGLLDLHGTVSVGGLGGKNQRDGSFEYYMSEPVRVNDNKGVGPFIMASLELEMTDSGPVRP